MGFFSFLCLVGVVVKVVFRLQTMNLVIRVVVMKVVVVMVVVGTFIGI